MSHRLTKRIFLWGIFILLHGKLLLAEHFVGGELFYRLLPNGQYEVTLRVYRDCNSSGATFDNPASVGIYTGNSLYLDLRLYNPVITSLSQNTNLGCVLSPPNLCTQMGVYKDTIVLPSNANGYDLIYTRCCRNNSIINIVDASDVGSSYISRVPPSGTINSSPRFNQIPPIFLCRNTPFTFDHSAFDQDGDQLVYSLCTPYSGASTASPMPQPPDPPPAGFVNWVSPFNSASPMPSSPAMSINPQTGQLFINPSLPGRYVVAVCVQEYRNGILLSEVSRDFQFNVEECDNSVSIITNQLSSVGNGQNPYCRGLTYSFENQSLNCNSFFWDFGVLGSTSDTSTLQEPTFTYPAPGQYNVMLIANNVVNGNTLCADTSFGTFLIYPELDPDFVVPPPQCLNTNAYQFSASGVFDPSASFNWSVNTGAGTFTSNQQSISNVTFTEDSTHRVSLIVSQFICSDTVTHDVYVNPIPEPEIGDITKYCVGLQVDFENLTDNGSNTYHWDFGIQGINSDTAVLFEPSYTFPDTGRYTITLSVTDTNNCSSAVQDTFFVFPLLSPSIRPFNDSNYVNQCFDSNQFNFQAQGVFSSNTSFLWEFGPNANISQSNAPDVEGVVFNQPGIFPVKLTMYENGCEKNIIDSVRIYNRPIIDFTVSSSRCAPFICQFQNLSLAETPMLHFWTFGDGDSSTLASPVYEYTEPGTYSPSLKIITLKGCKDTLDLVLSPPLQFMPSPITGLTPGPTSLSIFEPSITFRDTSKGGTMMIFETGDGKMYAEKEVTHVYADTGTYKVMQVVKNENGCADTLRFEVIVYPEFRLWIPNSFSPNRDLNNEFFKVVAIGISDFSIEIFDRWGQRIYESKDVTKGWDGTISNGKEAMDGIYNYRIQCKNPKSEVVDRRGILVLIR
ncbi:MAG: PKD domain-containing protein [Bacteroidota bacterium]